MSIFKDHFPRIGASGQSTGYTIDQSIRFNDDNSSLMSRTPSQASSSQRAFTISFWTKRGNLTSGNRGLFAWEGANDNSELRLYFDDNQLRYSYIDNNSYVSRLDTIKLFRDVSAWYHIVAVSDTENAVATERWKIYVNGVRETAFESTVYPSQNANIALFSSTSYLTVIGRTRSSSTSTYDGYLSEINVIDGYAYDPSYFGEFKTNTDIWIPKEYTGSYGNNGFYLKGQNSGALGNDSSGNDNDFSVTGLAAHDQVLDTPTNNFAVMNPLVTGNGSTVSQATYADGNLDVSRDSVSIADVPATISFPPSFKCYFEVYNKDGGDSGDDGNRFSILDENFLQTGSVTYFVNYYVSGKTKSTEQTESSAVTVVADGNIVGYAVDIAGGEVKVYIQGSLVKTFTIGSSYRSLNFFPASRLITLDSGFGRHIWNFGQEGTFSGNKTAQGNTDANGIGNFFYSPPSGFLALCSSNLGS